MLRRMQRDSAELQALPCDVPDIGPRVFQCVHVAGVKCTKLQDNSYQLCLYGGYDFH